MTPQMPELDATDAMIITVVVVEAFISLPIDDMPRDTARGVALLAEAILARIKPLLPQTDGMLHVFNGIAQVERTAAMIREFNGLPRKI
jgi:hypothetical protein